MARQRDSAHRRINEARGTEQRMALEDIMYICVLEKFVKLGVPMMPRLENVLDSQSGSFKKLTEVRHLNPLQGNLKLRRPFFQPQTDTTL